MLPGAPVGFVRHGGPAPIGPEWAGFAHPDGGQRLAAQLGRLVEQIVELPHQGGNPLLARWLVGHAGQKHAKLKPRVFTLRRWRFV